MSCPEQSHLFGCRVLDDDLDPELFEEKVDIYVHKVKYLDGHTSKDLIYSIPK